MTVVGVGVLVSTLATDTRLRDFRSLMVLDGVDEEKETISIRPADWLLQ